MKNFNLTKVNVLVVERQLFLRQLMREILHALGVAPCRYPTRTSFLMTPKWNIRRT